MKVIFTYLLLFSCLTKLNAQNANKCELMFKPIFGTKTIQLENTYYKLGAHDSILIESLKFYISNVELIQNGKIIWKEEKSFHLIDADKIASLSVPLQIPSNLKYDKIKFNIGIDSVTNTSGAMGGDLDPIKGMYWAWQSGYINFKLEGKSNLCQTMHQEYQFHLGGYAKPFNSLISITLNLSPTSEKIITVDVEKFISQIDLKVQNHIMSPSQAGVLLSENVAKIFSTEIRN